MLTKLNPQDDPINDIDVSDTVEYKVYREVNIYIFWFTVAAYRETLDMAIHSHITKGE